MAEEKKANVKVININDDRPVNEMSSEERKELVEALDREIQNRNREISEKLYLVAEGEKCHEVGERFVKFLNKEAKWKFTEAIGVIEATKEILSAAAEAKETKKFCLNILPLEALWFFINKVEGVGLPEAQYYSEHLLKPVAEALGLVKADREAVNQLLMRQGSLEAGADFEEELKEQPAMTEKIEA